MKVFVLGGGGRESAIIESLKKDEQVDEIHSNTLNPIEGVIHTAIADSDVAMLIEYFEEKDIDFVIVGPELPLSLGIVDRFKERFGKQKQIFGPKIRGARLEFDKSWSKGFMKKYGVPTADYEVFTDMGNAFAYIKHAPGEYVIKASGLAAGKGVFLPNNIDEAQVALQNLLYFKHFGAAGDKIIIEKRLKGKELSAFALFSENDYKLLTIAKDYKRVNDNDGGPNTGGMGAYSPAYEFLPKENLSKAARFIFDRVKEGLAAEKIDYTGVLYAGLMVGDNNVSVLEFNVRFGDPETQAILPLLDSSLLQILHNTAQNKPHYIEPKWKTGVCVNVVISSQGYPKAYKTGKEILGLEKIKSNFFFAGVKKENDKYYTNGGRVLNIYAAGSDMVSARENVYSFADKISFDGMHFRRDIGK